MGKVTMGPKDSTAPARKIAPEVVYVEVETPVHTHTITERIVEVMVDRPVETTIEKLIMSEPEIQVVEKLVLVQDPELLKKLEAAEYSVIQKDLDYKKMLDFSLEERETDIKALVRARSQYMVVRRQRSKLVSKWYSEKVQRIKSEKKFKITLAVAILACIAHLIR